MTTLQGCSKGAGALGAYIHVYLTCTLGILHCDGATTLQYERAVRYLEVYDTKQPYIITYTWSQFQLNYMYMGLANEFVSHNSSHQTVFGTLVLFILVNSSIHVQYL